MVKDKARVDIDMRSAGRPKSQGFRDDAVAGKHPGTFARGRGPGPKHGKRHR